MTSLMLPKVISCDESGFTGNRLLDPNQPYFAYGSTDLSDAEAALIISRIRSEHSVPMGELKAARMLKSAPGRRAIRDLLQQMDSRYIATIYDKQLCLGFKVFEYIYEPVLKRNSKLFYSNDLHRFVGTFIYMMIKSNAKGIDLFVEEFEQFMRTLDLADAPILFGDGALDQFDPMLHPFINFARGYNVAISQDIRSLDETGDHGKWVLDLTISAVTDHLRVWGDKHDIIDVVCDDSKPLRALSGIYDVMVNRPDDKFLEMFGHRHKLTWNMSKPVAFVDSKSHPAVQLADIVAGTATAVCKSNSDGALKEHAALIVPNSTRHNIIPDKDVIDPTSHHAMISQLVLFELAERAQTNADPIIGMDQVYHVAQNTIPQF